MECGILALVVVLLACSVAWAGAPFSVNVPYLDAAPTIDGRVSPGEWVGASGSLVFYATDEEKPAVPSGRFMIGQHGGKLYLALIAENMTRPAYSIYPADKDPNSLRAWYQSEPTIKTWRDDGFQVTLQSGKDQVLVIPNAHGFLHNRRNGDPMWKGEWEIGTSRFRTGRGQYGFIIELATPIDKLGLGMPKDGDAWQFQVALDLVNIPGYAVWNPLSNEYERLHVTPLASQGLGTLVWGGKPNLLEGCSAQSGKVRIAGRMWQGAEVGGSTWRSDSDSVTVSYPAREEYTLAVKSPGFRWELRGHAPAAKQSPPGLASPAKLDSFFPIGVFTGTPPDEGAEAWCDKVYADIAARGFNTVLVYGAREPVWKAILDSAQKHGLKAMVAAGPLVELSGSREPVLREQALAEARKVYNEIGSYPALLGYMLQDEPGLDSMPNWVTVECALAEVDPKHIAFSALDYPQIAAYQTKHSSNPEIAFDHYPHYAHVPLQSLGDFVLALDDYLRAADGVPLWPILPSFSGGAASAALHWRAPTPEESRAMVYLSLASGARGIFYWWYHGSERFPAMVTEDGKTTPIGEMITGITRELAKLEPLLAQLHKTRPLMDKGDYRIGTFADKSGREVLIVASKQPDKALIARLTVSGQKSWTDALTREQFVPSGGRLTVKLSPGTGKVLIAR